MPGVDNTSGINRVNSKRNRSIKLSSIYHQNWGGALPQSWPVPATAVAAGGSVAVPGPLLGSKSIPLTGTLSVGGYMQFDVPRNVVIVVTAAAVVALTGTITGLDIDGQVITEPLTGITTGGVSKTHTGLKAFKTVTDVTVVSVADATLDLIQIGSGNVLGLDVKSTTILPQIAQVDGVAIALTGLVAAVDSSATADPRGTWLPATLPNGVRVFDLYYISDDPWNS